MTVGDDLANTAMMHCPHCGATALEQRNTFGGAVHCPACGKTFEAQGAESIVAAEMAASPAPAASTMPLAPATGKPPVIAVAGINPYSDLAANPFVMPPMPMWKPDRNRALGKIQGPAILMQIYGVLLGLGGVGCLVAAPFIVPAMEGEDQIVLSVFMGIGMLGIPFGLLTLWAGTRMKALRSYGLAMTAVVLIFVIALLACVPAVIVGIWPLVALLDAEVKASFDKPA
jgi:hypothetical protein